MDPLLPNLQRFELGFHIIDTAQDTDSYPELTYLKLCILLTYKLCS